METATTGDISVVIDDILTSFEKNSSICACGTTLTITEPEFQFVTSKKVTFAKTRSYSLSGKILEKHPQTPRNPDGHILTDDKGRKQMYLDFEPL